MHAFDNVMVTYRMGSSGAKYLYLRADYTPSYRVTTQESHVESLFDSYGKALDHQREVARLGGTAAIKDECKRGVWFCFDWEDFIRLIPEWQAVAADGYHTVKKAGSELWMFFDIEAPSTIVRPVKREITISMVHLAPQTAQLLVRYGRHAFRKIQGLNPREQSMEHTVELTLEHRLRWADRYGQAKGEVEVIVDPRVAELVTSAQTDEKLKSKIEHLKNVTRNGTSTKWQTGKLYLMPDSPRGIYFSIRDPNGYQTMNGAVIDHGNSDWSIHT